MRSNERPWQTGRIANQDLSRNPEYQRLYWSGWAEAISFLALLGFAMPMKYIAGRPEFVRVIGSIHGFLFMIYVLFALLAAREWNWPGSRIGQAIVAAVLPFGPIWFDKKVRRWLGEK